MEGKTTCVQNGEHKTDGKIQGVCGGEGGKGVSQKFN